jgi:hypothetical protein
MVAGGQSGDYGVGMTEDEKADTLAMTPAEAMDVVRGALPVINASDAICAGCGGTTLGLDAGALVLLVAARNCLSAASGTWWDKYLALIGRHRLHVDTAAYDLMACQRASTY